LLTRENEQRFLVTKFMKNKNKIKKNCFEWREVNFIFPFVPLGRNYFYLVLG